MQANLQTLFIKFEQDLTPILHRLCIKGLPLMYLFMETYRKVMVRNVVEVVFWKFFVTLQIKYKAFFLRSLQSIPNQICDDLQSNVVIGT